MSGMIMKSTKARKQRKSHFNAPLHQRRKQFASHLEENLLLKYDRRRIPVVKGDTVRVMRGTFKGHEDKINDVRLKKHSVTVEGVVITKADGKKVAKPIHPSNLMITKLNLTDSWRRNILEKDLSDQTKKEIEKEATDQIHELEEQKRKAEEEAAAAAEEEDEEDEETGEEEIEEPSESEEPIEEVVAEKEETKEVEKTSGIKDKNETKEKTPASSEEKKTDSKEKSSSEIQPASAKKTTEPKSTDASKESKQKKPQSKEPAPSDESDEKKKEDNS